MHIKGLSKALKNPTHSKVWKKADVLGLHRKLDRVRRRVGLTRSKLMSRIVPSGGSTALNSAGAVIPSHVGRSITDLY